MTEGPTLAVGLNTTGKHPVRVGVRKVSHAYSYVPVLRDIDFELTTGRIHGLIGQNGAGKSTLIEILSGAIQPLSGQIIWEGEPITHASPAEATVRGLAVVHQNVQLFPDLTVASNIAGLSWNLPRRYGAVDRRAIRMQALRILEPYGFDLDPDQLVRNLDPASRKMVDIARALALKPRFLILDEPTVSFEPKASAMIMSTLKRLRDHGLGLCYISHRLDEVSQIADEVTVLRDGIVVHRFDGSPTPSQMAKAMLGQDEHDAADEDNDYRGNNDGGLSSESDALPQRSQASLNPDWTAHTTGELEMAIPIRKGEVIGLAGLVGSGASRFVRSLGGAESALPITLSTGGRDVVISTPREAIRVGIAFVPAERQRLGIIPQLSVAMNICMASLRKVSSFGLVRKASVRRIARDYQQSLNIKITSEDAKVSTLSGGNQQKVMIARALATGAEILAIEEPTQGVDIAARAQIHGLLRKFASSGGAVVAMSTDFDELRGFCDRIAVFRHGRVSTILAGEAMSSHEVLLAAVEGAGTL